MVILDLRLLAPGFIRLELIPLETIEKSRSGKAPMANKKSRIYLPATLVLALKMLSSS